MFEDSTKTAVNDSVLARAFDRAKIALCLIDSDLCYLWVNDAFAELLRYERRDLVGRSLIEITHPDDVDLDIDLSQRVFDGTIPYFSARKRYLGGDGSIVVSDLLATVVHTEDGTALGLGIQTDAAKLDPTTQRIETLQRSAAIGQLTASAVHDIRNSLSAISLIGETLHNTIGSSDAVALLRHEVEASQALLSSIATFARPPQPEPPTEAPLLSVGALVDQTRALLKLIVPSGTRLDIDLEDAALFPHIEPREFQQVVINLVLNARDAIVGEGGRILITAERTKGDENCTDICVADNGTGMSADDLERAFEPYFTTKGESGTGLGLSICRDIVERHGGSLFVESTLGQGTSFRVRLPVAFLQLPEAKS